MPPNMAEQMRGMADQMRANPAMAAQMRSMMQGMDSQQFKMMVRPAVLHAQLVWKQPWPVAISELSAHSEVVDDWAEGEPK